MTLNQIEYKTKEENGNKYTATYYNLGENYRVRRNHTTYSNGNTYLMIYVEYANYEEARNNYLPEIHYKQSFLGKEKPVFEVQTTSYGALNTEEIKKVIAGYQEALEAAELLNKRFC